MTVLIGYLQSLKIFLFFVLLTLLVSLISKYSQATRHIIWTPVKDDIDGKICYRFQTGELFWYFFITSFPKKHPVRELFLSEDGTLPVLISPWKEEEIIQKIAGLIAEKYSDEA